MGRKHLFVVLLLTVWALGLSGSLMKTVPAVWAEGAAGEAGHQASAVQAEVEHKGEAGKHAAEPGMFDFNIWILISQTINFFVLLFILKTFLYGPINAVLEERREKIQGSLLHAETENKKAGELKAEYEKRLGAVEEESYQIKKKALSEATSAKDEIVSGAKVTAEKLLEKAQKDITIERQKAWIELREEVVKLALLGAEKVIDKSLDDPTHHELIKKAIAELEAKP